MAKRKIPRDESATQEGPMLPLHGAIVKDDLETVIDLVQKGAAQVHPETKETPLHTAARVGSLKCLQWLLDNHINSPFDKASNGSSPVHYAAVYGQLEAMKVILMHSGHNGKQIGEQTDDNQLSILSLATLQEDIKMVKWIVAGFKQLGYIPDKKGNLPIHFAVAAGNLPIVKYLVEQYGATYADTQDSESMTKPVYYAAQDGKVDILDYLIGELDLDPVARDSTGNSTIHAAVMGNQLAAVKWLVKNIGPGIIVDRTKDGATPLHVAAAHGFVSVLEYLVRSMKDKNAINSLDNISATPAHDAAEFGQLETMLILIRHGADINIKDTENKTPFDLAVDKGNTEVVRMIADYREHGTMALNSYEKGTRKRSATAPPSSLTPLVQQRQGKETPETVRTNSEVAMDLSDEINKAHDLLDKRRDRELHRQRSLQELDKVPADDEPIADTGDELEAHLGKSRGRERSRSKDSSGDKNGQEDIAREAGPNGQLYAKVKKPRGKKALAPGSHRGSDLDDQMSEAMSHTSSQFVRNAMLDPHDPGYFSVNHAGNNMETASNFSRPSRAKYYRDPDNRSELSSRTGSSISQNLRNGRHNVPGFYPSYGPVFQPQYPGQAPAHMRRMPHSISGTSLGSETSARDSHRMMYMPPVPPGYPPPHLQYPHYPYYPNMVAQYYGYPWPGQTYPVPKPKTMEERIHMDALQRRGHPPYPPPQSRYPPHHQQHHNRRAPPPPPPLHGHKGGRKHRSRPSSERSAPPLRSHSRHTDRDIGFGPSGTEERHRPRSMEQDDRHFHPAPPPITKSGKPEDAEPLSSLDGNFILVRPDEQGMVQATSGTTALVRAPPPKTYDGRWDQYIMTDSEDDHEVNSNLTVSRLAECALIISLGSICGLKGLEKARTKGKGKKNAKSSPGKGEGSSPAPWDLEIDVAQQQLLSADFVDAEEQKASQNWSSQDDQMEEQKADKEWAQTLGMSLNPVSVSTEKSMKQLGGSLRARNFAMMGLGPSIGGQLTRQSQQNSDSDDNDENIISIIHGIELGEQEGTKERSKSDKQGKGKEKSERKGKDKKTSKKGGKEKPLPKDGDKSKLKKDKKAKDQKAKKQRKSKTMQVIATPPRARKEVQESTITMIDDSSDEGSHVFDLNLTSEVVPTSTRTNDEKTITSIAVRASVYSDKDTQQSSSTGPVEVRNVFDSLSDTDHSTEEVPLAGQSTDSLDMIFAKTQKEIEQIIAEIPTQQKASDAPSSKPIPITVEENVGTEGRGHYTETKITFKGSSLTDDDEEVQEEKLKKLTEMFPSNSTRRAGGREEVDIAENPEAGLLLQSLDTSRASPQQLKRLQMIQQIMAYKDPELMKQLLGLLSEGWNPMRDHDSLESTSGTQLVADIEQKLLQVQEKQRQESQEQIRSQAEFSQTLQRRLEEQAEKHLQTIQEQFAQQRDLLLNQLEEQRKIMEEDRKKRRQEDESSMRASQGKSFGSETESEDNRKVKRTKKKQKQRKFALDSGSETDEDLLLVHATPLPISIPKQEIKTMRAELYQQKELVWDDYFEPSGSDAIPDPPPPPSASYLTQSLPQSHSFERSHLMAGFRARRQPISSVGRQQAIEALSSASSLGDNVEMPLARPQTKSETRQADIFKVSPDDADSDNDDVIASGQQGSPHQARATTIVVN